MPNLPKGTVVGQGNCVACGKPGRFVVSKTGSVFMICTQPDDVTFEPCNTRLFFGKTRSQEMQRVYLETRASAKKEAIAHDRPSDVPDHAEPARTTDEKPKTDSGDIFSVYG